jgi:hypothetical protein
MPRNRTSRGRVHIVLIPGFAGFDALGQLEYYAGVTPQFQQWKDSRQGRNSNDVALHYFDNFPTAAVRTRSARLLRYLTTRMARGEFAENDSIALVGHSTGGLDIRWLLWELNRTPSRSYPVDGATMSDRVLTAADILPRIKHLVFLSVPQWGTNIADWVRSYKVMRQLVVTDLCVSFKGTQVPFLGSLEESFWNCFSKTSKMGIVEAVRDVVSESETSCGDTATQVADAQEAASETQLWLRHIATDFDAIDDLACENGARDPQSPAHFDAARRKEEIKGWKDLKTRSYATVGARPFAFTPGEAAPVWDLCNPLTSPLCTPRPRPSPKSDVLYCTAYRACAGGPFQYPDGDAPVAKPFFPKASGPRTIELWDNDAIVNTASMFWPNGKDTLLVECDHMDIVGHYEDVPSVSGGCKRKYQSYDLFKSGSNFTSEGFEQVWNDVFGFCVSP